MGSFRGSINLLSLLGAEVVSMEVNGKVRNVVAIPVGWNDITVTMNETTQKPNAAYLNLRAWETNDAYKKACVEKNADKEGYIAPSHNMQVSYSETFQENAQKAATARLIKDETFMAKSPTEEAIAQQAKYDVSNKSRIGTLTPLARKQPAQYTGQATQTSAGAWVAPAAGQDGHVNPDEDLPF